MKQFIVTLYVRVWIETISNRQAKISAYVTLYVRVWIETFLRIFDRH